jgi:hypothetical protein
MRPPRQAKLICVFALSVGVLTGIGATTAEAGPPPAAKVTICHYTHGKNGSHWITLTVAASAVPAHIRNHEDFLGPCPTLPKASTNGDSASKASTPAKTDPPKKEKPGNQPSAGKPAPKPHDTGNGKPASPPTTTTPEPTTSDTGSTTSGSDNGKSNGNSNGTGNANGNAGGNGNANGNGHK